MTERTTPERTIALTWDGLDQLRIADGPDDGQGGFELYYYDHTGARVLAINEEGGVRFWFGESETHFDLNGQQSRRYLHLMAGGGTLARVENGSKLELQYADSLQNLMLSLDTTGQPTASFHYGPFGEVIAASGEADHRRQFNGKENDALTGLRYYGFRYYDPLTVRWNSADPLYRFLPDLGLNAPQRLNLYSFSLNNPVRYYDPDGRQAEEGESGEDVMACWWKIGAEHTSCQFGVDMAEFDEDAAEDFSEEDDKEKKEEGVACDPQNATCVDTIKAELEAEKTLLELYVLWLESGKAVREEEISKINNKLKTGKSSSLSDKVLGVGGAVGSAIGSALACLSTALTGCGAAVLVGLGTGSASLDKGFENKDYSPGEVSVMEFERSGHVDVIKSADAELNRVRQELSQLRDKIRQLERAHPVIILD
jgi:RHS repeat-associated protein